jgi:hypothetical protein
LTERKSGVNVEGDFAVIRIPLEDVHSLRVALKPCQCKTARSLSTQNIRTRLVDALAKLGVRKS